MGINQTLRSTFASLGPLIFFGLAGIFFSCTDTGTPFSSKEDVLRPENFPNSEFISIATRDRLNLVQKGDLLIELFVTQYQKEPDSFSFYGSKLLKLAELSENNYLKVLLLLEFGIDQGDTE